MIDTPAPETLDRQLEIAVCRLADDLRFGQDASPYSGAGIEYLQSRPFVEGDAVRDIDWRVTARTQRFHVKQYEALRSTPAYLVVDTSASMAFSSQPFSKHKLAVLLAGGLALAALRRLSPVGVLAGGQRRLHVRPSLQRGRVFQWLHALATRRLRRADALGAAAGSTRRAGGVADAGDCDQRPARSRRGAGRQTPRAAARYNRPPPARPRRTRRTAGWPDACRGSGDRSSLRRPRPQPLVR